MYGSAQRLGKEPKCTKPAQKILPYKPFHLNRLHRKPFLGENIIFDRLARSDKQDLSIWIMSLKGFGIRNSRIHMSPGSARSNHHSHSNPLRGAGPPLASDTE